ncbi:MAG TPA: hypothetical protein VFA07_15950 [Chthonomonadaceae bacterium]|nr:hypothetical protein [Chthonomonadaceae bacterium]
MALEKDTFIEGEATLDPDILTAALEETMQDVKAWKRGKKRLRVTEMADGHQITRFVTAEELQGVPESMQRTLRELIHTLSTLSETEQNLFLRLLQAQLKAIKKP